MLEGIDRIRALLQIQVACERAKTIRHGSEDGGENGIEDSEQKYGTQGSGKARNYL